MPRSPAAGPEALAFHLGLLKVVAVRSASTRAQPTLVSAFDDEPALQGISEVCRQPDHAVDLIDI